MTEKEMKVLVDMIIKNLVEKQKELDENFIENMKEANGEDVDFVVRNPDYSHLSMLSNVNFIVNQLDVAIANEEYELAKEIDGEIKKLKKYLNDGSQ
jgi:protein-arginine kinase activator protein McsA